MFESIRRFFSGKRESEELDLLPVERDAVKMGDYMLAIASTLSMAGRHEEATKAQRLSQAAIPILRLIVAARNALAHGDDWRQKISSSLAMIDALGAELFTRDGNGEKVLVTIQDFMEVVQERLREAGIGAGGQANPAYYRRYAVGVGEVLKAMRTVANGSEAGEVALRRAVFSLDELNSQGAPE